MKFITVLSLLNPKQISTFECYYLSRHKHEVTQYHFWRDKWLKLFEVGLP